MQRGAKRTKSQSGVVIFSLAFFAAIGGIAAMGGYLGMLYRQMEQAFSQQDQFIPTRIFSDVHRIAPPQQKSKIEERLRALGYQASASVRDEGLALTIQLHTINYPEYLLPEGHPTIEAAAAQSPITLLFDGKGSDSLLQSVAIEAEEVAEIFLEPELVATLGRSSSSGGAGVQTKKQVREWLRFDQIPAPVWQAIIAIEDQHFLDHHGLDPRGIARAIWVNLKSMRLAQGGSTITQQLVKNLMARRTKNIAQKINEVFLAMLLEMKYDKEEILERYLNEVYLGQIGNLEIHGVAEGAKHFFAKRLDDLNLGEIALMAGLIRGPGFYSPYRQNERAIERQRLVLKKMVETGKIAATEASDAEKLPIRLAPPQTVANKAPYFVDFVKAELIRHLKDQMGEEEVSEAGLRVYTTLDITMNNAAQRAVSQGVASLEKKLPGSPRLEAALASVDHSTGVIRSLVGGRSYADSTFNRILNMKRQVGSTFKPIAYLAALQKGQDRNGIQYGPGYPTEDSAWTLHYDHGKQTWSPKNYENEFKGWIPLRQSLAHSVNTVAAKVGWDVGPENIINTARALGIESHLPAVPSLALGVAELSPVELLRAYAALANHGVLDELTVIRGISHDDGSQFARFVYHPKMVTDPAPVDLLTDLMTSVFQEGTALGAAHLGFDRPAAGKTGTTSHHRDAWFAGYTPQLTTVVWVGMDQQSPQEAPEPRQKKSPKSILTGSGAALPIWVSFMNEALEGEPPIPFPLSPHLGSIRIDRHTGQAASPDCPDAQILVEKYILGREPKTSTCDSEWPASVPVSHAI